MKAIAIGVMRLFGSYLAIICIIGMLPVFLFTSEIPLYNSLIDYLFNNHKG